MLQYFSHVAHEFRYIRWLSVRRSLVLTVIVIVVALITGFALGALDSIFARILKGIVI